MAGCLRHYSDAWRKLTNDKIIMDMVEHCHIDFKPDFFVLEKRNYSQYKFNSSETEIINSEITKLLELGVIKKVEYEPGQFVSPIFIRPKKNGEHRMILNLKKINSYIPYFHFKMDTFEKTLTLIKPGMYMASCDLRHAYYSVPVAEEHQKYLRFEWNGTLYQYTCFPNGLACCPRLFTKLLKPVFAKLQTMGHVVTGFIDDSLQCGETYIECVENVQDTRDLMVSLGFMLNLEKSIFIPTQVITFLGNIIDSKQMIVYLPQGKKDAIQLECRKLYQCSFAKIRRVAQVIGMIVASFSAVEFGKMHYRVLEISKSKALKRNFGNYDATMVVSRGMKIELKWWMDNVQNQVRHITHGTPELTIQTDSSKIGFGFVIGNEQYGGRWSQEEKKLHINVLELIAIKFALKALSDRLQNKHILVLSDSSTAVCYVQNMGGICSLLCNKVAIEIWEFCVANKIWLSCAHIAGVKNEADKPSREFNDELEWELHSDVFQSLCDLWCRPEIDLFASRLNTKLRMFCSWKPDPEAAYTDAFTLDWSRFANVYIFCPFSLIGRCIRKIAIDMARGFLIVPLWPSQSWWAALMRILVDKPRILPFRKDLLRLPYMDRIHPLQSKLVLVVCKVSGHVSENKDFLKTLPEYSCHHGAALPNANIKYILRDGYYSVLNNKLIQFQFL